MRYFMGTISSIFTGNVKITRENGYLNADKVTIYRDIETDDVIKTVAEGNVDHAMIVLNHDPAGCTVGGIHAAAQNENEKTGQ